jgi:hypothetical protein
MSTVGQTRTNVLWRHIYAKMTLPEALRTLGVSARATREEIIKAYKQKALILHPDRNPGKDTNDEMVALNVAKDLLLGEGTSSPQPVREEPPPRPRPEPPKVVDTIPGQTFEAATAFVSQTIEWKAISKPIYAKTKDRRGFYSEVWTLIGVTDQKLFVAGIKRRDRNQFFDQEKGGLVQVELDWQCQIVHVSRTPANKPIKVVPQLVKKVSIDFEDGTISEVPRRYIAWPEGRLVEHTVTKVKGGSGGASLKEILLTAGLVSAEDPAMAGRKTNVEMFFKRNKEKEAVVRQEMNTTKRAKWWFAYDYYVRVNGKEYLLAEDTVRNLDKSGFIMGVLSYKISPDDAPKNLTRSRGDRFGLGGAAVAIRLLANSMTSEPSELIISLEKAAEEWEEEPAKTAAQRVADRFWCSSGS